MKSVLFVWILLCFLLLCAFEEDEVSCVFMERCVLPCSFQSGPDPLVHWFKTPDDTAIHSFYRGQNQLSHQNQDYRGRTSLFGEEISRGNASLLLSQVKVQDEGTYECFTETASQRRATFINLRVKAPVAEVELQQEEEELLCRSEGIYPQPEVSWTPSTEHHTTVKKTESGLYSVVSSVRLPHSPPHEHSCNISTLHSWKSATYRMRAPIKATSSKVTILCTDSTSTVRSLIWKFNLTQIILNKTGSELVYSQSWRPFVGGVSESNNRLVLKGLTSDHQGLYSCVLRTDTEMFVISTGVTETEMVVKELWLRSRVVCGALLILVILIISFSLWKHLKRLQARKESATEVTTPEGVELARLNSGMEEPQQSDAAVELELADSYLGSHSSRETISRIGSAWSQTSGYDGSAWETGSNISDF